MSSQICYDGPAWAEVFHHSMDGSSFPQTFPWELTNTDYFRRVLGQVGYALQPLVEATVKAYGVVDCNNNLEAAFITNGFKVANPSALVVFQSKNPQGQIGFDAFMLIKHVHHGPHFKIYASLLGCTTPPALEKQLEDALDNLKTGRNKLAHMTLTSDTDWLTYDKMESIFADALFVVKHVGEYLCSQHKLCCSPGASCRRLPPCSSSECYFQDRFKQNYAAANMTSLYDRWKAHRANKFARRLADRRFMSEGADLSKLVELRTLKGHSDDVESVAVFPDGRLVVSGSEDSTLKVWDVATGECVATLEGHLGDVYGVAVFPDWRCVVSAGDRTLKIWDVETGECVATLEGHSGYVTSVAISPDGRRIVSASNEPTLKVWDVLSGQCVATLRGHSAIVKCVAISPDGRRVVSGSMDKTLKVWDVATGKCVATLEGHSYCVTSVAVFPDGRRIVSGSWDNTLKVWDVATSKCVATLRGHSNSVSGVAVSPDGRRVVSGSMDKTLKVWDVATGKCVATLEGHSYCVTSVAVFPDGRRVVSGCGGELKVYGLSQS